MRRTLPAALATLALAVALPAAPAEADAKAKGGDFFFRKGDRVVFLGDSITEQYQYSSYLELYLTTRFPAWDLTFLNAGISGDTAAGGAGRFQAHVLDEKPTAVTIDFGMNDGGYGGFNAGNAANYVNKTEAMLKAARGAGARVALISPNAVEVRARPDLKTYLETQARFYAPLGELAARYDVPFVDQYLVTRRVLEKLAADKAPVHPFPDGVHTNAAGGLLMAHTILAGLHAPAVVSDVKIDAAASRVKVTRCKVGAVQAGPDGVSFERTDEALPLPVQKDWRPLLPYLDDLRDLNYYGLTVTGLTGERYQVTVDGKPVGTYTAKELAAGVNLGNATSGPLHEQGQKVLEAINAKNDIVHGRFRGVVMYTVADWLKGVGEPRKAEELRRRKEQIDAKQAEVYKLARPKPHRFEVVAAK